MALKIAIIIATVMHDGGPPLVISGPEIPYEEQKARFKQHFASERIHQKFARVELVDTRRGTVKHQNLISPEESASRAKELARQEKEFKRLQKPSTKPSKISSPADQPPVPPAVETPAAETTPTTPPESPPADTGPHSESDQE